MSPFRLTSIRQRLRRSAEATRDGGRQKILAGRLGERRHKFEARYQLYAPQHMTCVISARETRPPYSPETRDSPETVSNGVSQDRRRRAGAPAHACRLHPGALHRDLGGDAGLRAGVLALPCGCHPPQESSGADTSEGVGLIEFEKGYELYTAHAETVDDVRYVFDWNSRPSFLRPGGPR